MNSVPQVQMSKQDWAEIVEWINDRFPGREWDATQIRSYYEDVRRFDPADVWAAIYMLYPNAHRPPLGSELAGASQDKMRERILAQRGEVPLNHRDDITWKQYSERVYGRVRPMAEVILEFHATLAVEECAALRCEIHGKEGPAPIEETLIS